MYISIQVGPRSIELDKLVQDMTDFYKVEENRQERRLKSGNEKGEGGEGDDSANVVSAGDVVAAQWPGDDKWYRARVVAVIRDEYDEGKEPELDIDFVDFGDCDKKPLEKVFDLRADFLGLSFQAIECTLAGVEPM